MMQQAVEDTVRAIMERVFQGRKVTFINATRLNWVGGGIHCATNSQPASLATRASRLH